MRRLSGRDRYSIAVPKDSVLAITAKAAKNTIAKEVAFMSLLFVKMFEFILF